MAWNFMQMTCSDEKKPEGSSYFVKKKKIAC